MKNYLKIIDKLSKICENINAGSLSDKMKILINGKNDRNAKDFYSLLGLMINENGFVSNDDLSGYKELICEKILKVLDSKDGKYRPEKLFNTFLMEKNNEFNKLLYISYLIGKQKDIYWLFVLFWILKEENLDSLKKLGIANTIEGNKFFIYLVSQIDINVLKKAKDNKKVKEVNINDFLKNDNDSFAEYFFNSSRNEKKDDIFKRTNNDDNIFNENNNNSNNENFGNINIANNNNANNGAITEINTDNIGNVINNTNNNLGNENINKINIDIGNTSEDNENNNDIISNILNNEKIIMNEKLKKERTERIKKLISKTLSIDFSKALPEKPFLKLNYNKMIETKVPIDFNDLLFDVYDNKDETKLHLFSPISLVLNNIKEKFEKSDFEIFNEDNHYIDMFGSYLEEVIDKLNSYINHGTEKDYIDENKIKFGCYRTHYYIICQLTDEFKEKYYKEKSISQKRIIDNNPTNDKINILKIKSKKSRRFEQFKKDLSDKIGNFSAYSSSKIADENYRNKESYMFKEVLNKFISEKDSEKLQNIILFFNSKIPKINEEDGIKFHSVKLCFDDKPSKLYGFREIDICFKNRKEREININEILSNNICYLNNKKKKEEDINVIFQENSIIFCEVKNAFSKIKPGSEKCSEIHIEEGKYEDENEDKDNDTTDNMNLNYMDNIDNLYKKAKLFYHFFIKENIIGENEYIHILYLYDESNVTSWEEEYDDILKNIDNFFREKSALKEFKKVIFQFAYFDKIKNIEYERNNNESLKKIIRDKDEEIKSKNNNNESLKKIISEKDEEIKSKNNIIENKDEKIKKLKKLLKENNIEIDD